MKRKKKDVAGILALVLGGFGIHQFYLNKPGWGIAHAIFFWNPVSWIIAWISAIVIFSMGEEEFDRKYNRSYSDYDYGERESRRDRRRTDFDRRDRGRERDRGEYHRDFRREQREARRERDRDYQRRRENRPPPAPKKKPNPYKQSGIKKYKEYDYDGAIEDFLKALEIDSADIATHFNLACAYSLNEDAQKSFYHLDKAMSLGFKDTPKIKEHDALAFIRIQDEFELFEKNGFRLASPHNASENNPAEESVGQLDSPKEDLLQTQPDLLDQLKKLGELKDKGLLTEEEFASQKKKLLR